MRRRLGQLHRDEQATATVEFALVFPFLLAFALILTQSAFLLSGNLYVHYAAQAAARTASVRIGSASELEPANFIVTDRDNSPKYRAIQQAGVIAVAPASGRMADQIPDGFEDLPAQLTAYLDADETTSAGARGWLDNTLLERFRYAQANTIVQIALVDGQGEFEIIDDNEVVLWGATDPVGVVVTHRLHLGVPYASALFSDGTHETAGGKSAYVNITAQALAVNAGIPSTMPLTPRLERRP